MERSVFVESLGGIRHVSVRKYRIAIDWAEEIKYLVDVSFLDMVQRRNFCMFIH